MTTHYSRKSIKSRDRDNSIKQHGSQIELVKKISKQKSSSKFKESFLAETFGRFRTRRMTVRMAEGESYTLRPLATVHFREDFGGISCLRWSPGGDTVAVGFYSGDLKLCSRPRLMSRPVETIIKGWEGNYPLSCIKFHPEHPEMIYASSLSGSLSVSNSCPEDGSTDNSKQVITEEGNEINSFDFSCDGASLVTGGKDAAIRVYDSKTHKMVLWFRSCLLSSSTETTDASIVSEDRHEKRVFCVKSHPEQPQIFLTGGWDRVVKVWDTRVKGNCVRNILGPYIFGECIDISKRNVLTASCVAEGSLDLWDLGSGCLITKVVPVNKPVYLFGEFPYAAQFHKGSEDLVLCGGVGLGGLQVISVDEQMILHLVEDDRPVIAIDSLGTQTAFGGKSNSVSFVDARGEIVEENLVQTQESESVEDTALELNDEKKSTGSSLKEDGNENNTNLEN